ncbi:MAG: FAD-binding oxidoreductase [bacterium]|nr:FAD-binding oxidoreductase [bacterium]
MNRNITRRFFLSGMAIGAFGALGLSELKNILEDDPNIPQLLYEFSTDNFWFTKVDKNLMVINNPLKGNHKAHIVIIGGGFTGLSTAYHLAQRYPNKKIVVLEGAYCGYGASGRNGGHHGPEVGGIDEYSKEFGLEKGIEAYKLTEYGEEMIKTFVNKHGIDCEFNEKGSLEAALTEEQMLELEETRKEYALMGIKAELLQGESFKKEIQSPIYIGGLKVPNGGRVNPAKLVRGMKKVVEEMGVEIREQTQVLKVRSGKTHLVETEQGTITAPVLVLGLNAYSHNLGYFKSGTIPVAAYNIATAPLSKEQLSEIGWQKGSIITDSRDNFNYLLLSEDKRIIIGGSEYPYYANDGLSTGNNKQVLKILEEDLFYTFPQLEGLKIDHKWGGSVSMTRDFAPSVGVMGTHKNIFYGVGYCGHGVSFAHTAARIMSDLIAREKTEFSEYFLVNRPLPYLGPRSLRYMGFKLFSRFF